MDATKKKPRHKGIIVDEFEQLNSLPAVDKKITERVSVVEHDLSAAKISKPVETEPLDEGPLAERSENLTIKISGSAGKKIIEEFDVSEIGNIDLKEAEQIAGEDMLFLTESDLIEGLEDFDLIPLVDEKEEVPQKEEIPEPSAAAEPAQETKLSEPAREVAVEEKTISDPPRERVKDSFDNIEVEIIDDKSELIYAEDEQTSTPEIEAVEEERGEEEKDLFDMPLIIEEETGQGESTESVESEWADDVIFTDEELASRPGRKPVQEVETGDPDRTEKTSPTDEELKELMSDEASSEREPVSEDMEQGDMVGEATAIEMSSLEVADDTTEDADLLDREAYQTFEKEILPDELQALEVIEDNVLFIDDIIIDKPDVEDTLIFSGDRIENLSTGYVDLSQVEGIVLEESEEKETPGGRIADANRFRDFEELAIDFDDDDYKYRDDELDFVQNAIFEEDYSRYIYEIDDLYHIESQKDISSAREILGLDTDDLSHVHDKLFNQEYINVNLDEIFNLIREETYAGALKGERFCNYLLPGGDTLLSSEKASIEEDISATGALIFEEDIHLIKEKLGRSVSVEEKKTVSISEEVFDITDNIVIIEDDLDVDRFVKELPNEKQGDMKHLLKYLDGLFEKLPEEVIRKFAESEYFDVYAKVLSEMGI